jgi:hypothetical protein
VETFRLTTLPLLQFEIKADPSEQKRRRSDPSRKKQRNEGGSIDRSSRNLLASMYEN